VQLSALELCAEVRTAKTVEVKKKVFIRQFSTKLSGFRSPPAPRIKCELVRPTKVVVTYQARVRGGIVQVATRPPVKTLKRVSIKVNVIICLARRSIVIKQMLV
jgi:hypothetical protein